MATPGVIIASLAAAWNTSGPSQRMEATTSMPCPHQVGGIHLRADAGGAGQVDEPAQGDRREDQVVRVHLDGDPDAAGPGLRVDPGPELGGDPPLVVQDVQVYPVPGVHHPGRVPRAGVGAGGAGHRDHVRHAEQARELDGAPQVVGVLGADAGQRVERVAVAVQPGELHPPGGEHVQVRPPGLVRGQQQVDVAVRGGDEAAGVDLDRGQAVGLEHVQGLGERTVVQAGGVGTEFHLA